MGEKTTLRERLGDLAKRTRCNADMLLICEAIGALKASEDALRAVAPAHRPDIRKARGKE